jgi:hypothetical protein
VRRLGNSLQFGKMNGRQSGFLLGSAPGPLVDSHSWRRTFGAREPAHSGREEASMDLRMRLNVLAAIISLAFLTAIVVGMI